MEGSNVSTSAAPAAEGSTNSNENTQNDQSVENRDNDQAVAQAPTKKKFKLKVDGQEVEEEIDLNDEDTLKRHLQMSKAAQKRMAESAQLKKQAEQFIHELRTNPIKLLSNPNLGLDFRKIAEEYLAKQLEIETLSPEQRRMREMEEQLRQYEENKKRSEDEQRSKQQAELEKHYAQDYDKKITEALATSGLPKTAKTVKRMAELMYLNLKHGFELEPRQLVERVREDYLNEVKELFGASDGDVLLKILGDDTANKIRKADLARLKTVKPEPKAMDQVTQPSNQKRMSTEEWMEEVRRRARS